MRGTDWRAHGLRLRVGLVPVSALHSPGCNMRVARHAPMQGNSFGIFAGGVSMLEEAIRGHAWPGLGPPAEVAELDGGAPVDRGGMSKPARGAAFRSGHEHDAYRADDLPGGLGQSQGLHVRFIGGGSCAIAARRLTAARRPRG